ncbi:MAG: methylenetetrahydrofolate reductase [NAD(P)H] [Phycisphaera sp.]|nr:methylenetetrahydrofolate reductase [NAD(P)H] [Phycisphaera sp.]
MRIAELLKANPVTFSFEFFPPKNESAVDLLLARAEQLAKLRPTFVSVTYGAGGTTRDRTRDVVVRLQDAVGLSTAAHLTCVGHSRAELIEILETYLQRGVTNIVALRGDAPNASTGFQPHPDGLTHANELVELIRERFGDKFGVAVAGYPEGHPETPNKITDLDNLKRKVDAGADVVVTQLFFDNHDFYDFCERCELAKIDVPVIAGIMPVQSRKGIMRMAGLCGSRIPAKLLRRLDRAGDNDDEVAKVGIDWATQQCRDLLEHHVRGIHFYTLNRSTTTMEIYRRLGASDSEALAHLAGA